MLDEDMPIVATVIDPYRVVINKGANQDISEGQRFLIFVMGEEVLDPSTGKSLGNLEIVRGRGKVTHLQENLATISCTDSTSYRQQTRNPFSFIGSTTDIFKETEEPFDDPEVGDYAKPI